MEGEGEVGGVLHMQGIAMPTATTGSSNLRTSSAFVLVLAVAATLAGCQSDQEEHAGAQNDAQLVGEGIAVYVAGDIADCQKLPPHLTGAAATAALVARRLATDPDAAVLTLGDHTYPVGLLHEFAGCYDATWGQFKERTFPSPGNHEYYTPQANGYYRYFDGAAGPARRGYYSFALGDWHIISLNSNLRPSDHAVQLAWLRADLERHKTRCTLAYWHHPLYSSGVHGNDKRMQDVWEMLHAADADLVLVSHDHQYERFAPQDAAGRKDAQRGIRQFVVGTGGAELGSSLPFRAEHSEIRNNSTHGVLKLVLKKAGYEWQFLPVEEDGFSDRGSARCH